MPLNPSCVWIRLIGNWNLLKMRPKPMLNGNEGLCYEKQVFLPTDCLGNKGWLGFRSPVQNLNDKACGSLWLYLFRLHSQHDNAICESLEESMKQVQLLFIGLTSCGFDEQQVKTWNKVWTKTQKVSRIL